VTSQASTADLLSASSVLAAILTFLYGNAYSTITTAIDIDPQGCRPRPCRRHLQPLRPNRVVPGGGLHHLPVDRHSRSELVATVDRETEGDVA